ncbi:MAG: hypothetical protein DRG24_07260 [Epsilonproteobacteria bacterium]|nr:MAG: hypothetical protein DRG24_07260 [Campylobacterota bacterium]
MKKLFLTLFLSAVLWAEAGIYIGAGGTIFSENFTFNSSGFATNEMSSTYTGAKFKIGYGDREAYMIEFGLSYGEYDKNIFSDDDGMQLFVDVDIIKAFDFGIGAYPFFKFGFGAGNLKIARTLNSSIASGSFHGGGGIYIPLFETDFEVEVSAIYRWKHFEGINLVGEPADIDSNLIEPYIGLGYRF